MRNLYQWGLITSRGQVKENDIDKTTQNNNLLSLGSMKFLWIFTTVESFHRNVGQYAMNLQLS